MKYILILSAALMMSAPQAFAKAEKQSKRKPAAANETAYWSCQCFESQSATDALSAVDVGANEAKTLEEAQIEAVRKCDYQNHKVRISQCLHFAARD